MATIILKFGNIEEREEIYRIRYQVYAEELHQHHENKEMKLKDDLDAFNEYIIAKVGNEIAGFISITPPNGKYSIDKYRARDTLPFLYHNAYELRILTVVEKYRKNKISLYLLYALARYVSIKNGDLVIGIGRDVLMDFYKSIGFIDAGEEIYSGKVVYRLMFSMPCHMQEKIKCFDKMIINKLQNAINELPFSLVD